MSDGGKHIEHLLCARCALQSPGFTSQRSLAKRTLISPCYQWGNRGIGRILNGFPEDGIGVRFPGFSSGFLPSPKDCSIPDLFVLILPCAQFQICHSVSGSERRQSLDMVWWPSTSSWFRNKWHNLALDAGILHVLWVLLSPPLKWHERIMRFWVVLQ